MILSQLHLLDESLLLLGVFLDKALSGETEERISQLNEVKKELMKELESICEDCIDLIEKTLLPVAKSIEAKIFYEKMEADYYRYFCEFIEDGEERNAVVVKSKA